MLLFFKDEIARAKHNDMPTTPAAEPEAAVETKEVVETPAFVSAPTLTEEQAVDKREDVETPPAMAEETIATDGPYRKLSKKEKKRKGKQPAVDPVESSETATQSSAPPFEGVPFCKCAGVK
jgi:hypothetical protein